MWKPLNCDECLEHAPLQRCAECNAYLCRGCADDHAEEHRPPAPTGWPAETPMADHEALRRWTESVRASE